MLQEQRGWERKQKHNAQDKRIREVLKDRKRQRKADRQRRLEAGEPVSDSSSVKERKQKQKEKYLADLKRMTITSQEEIDEQRRQTIFLQMQEQAKFAGKNLTTIKKNAEN